MSDREKIMSKALEEIWEVDPDEPYEAIAVMQRIALTALEQCGFAQPYLTKGGRS